MDKSITYTVNVDIKIDENMKEVFKEAITKAGGGYGGCSTIQDICRYICTMISDSVKATIGQKVKKIELSDL